MTLIVACLGVESMDGSNIDELKSIYYNLHQCNHCCVDQRSILYKIYCERQRSQLHFTTQLIIFQQVYRCSQHVLHITKHHNTFILHKKYVNSESCRDMDAATTCSSSSMSELLSVITHLPIDNKKFKRFLDHGMCRLD